MPNVAAIQTFQDSNLEIPDPTTGVTDRHFQFDLPDYVPRESLLMFRLRALEDSIFQFRIQGTDTLVHNLKADATRTFHENYPGGALKEAGNELILSVGAGRVAVSDILILYQVNASKDPFAGSVINVKDHGATGSVFGNDTDELQAAIEASQPGNALYFPPGTYVVSEPLQPKAHQLYFSLTDRVILKAESGKPGFAMFDVRTCPVEFRHLTIDGTREKRSRPRDLARAAGIWVRPDKGTVGVVVSACRIRNTHGNGIRIEGDQDAERAMDRVIVRDTVVEDCGWRGNGNGLGVAHVDNVRVESTRFENCHNGIKMLDCRDVVVRGVTATANRRHGIVFTFSHRWHVGNCVAERNGSELDVAEEPGGWGIAAGGEPITDLTPNDDFTITNNICEDNAEGGITLDPTDAENPTMVFEQRARVSGNVCQGLRTATQPLDEVDPTRGSHGIHVRNSSAVVLTDNTCHHNNRSGIAVVNASHVLVQANTCYTNLNGIGLPTGQNIADPGGHVIGVNLLHNNNEDLKQGDGPQEPPRTLPGVRLYGLHGNDDPNLTVAANPGSVYERHEDEQGSLYVKQSGNQKEGWERLATEA
jgi:parallel beta-helix repeat protein